MQLSGSLIPGTPAQFNRLFVIKSTRDYCKANNAKYCNGDTPRDHNIPLFSLDNPEQSLRTSPTWDQFQAFSWFKNIFGEIHIPHGNFGVGGGGGGSLSAPLFSFDAATDIPMDQGTRGD